LTTNKKRGFRPPFAHNERLAVFVYPNHSVPAQCFTENLIGKYLDVYSAVCLIADHAYSHPGKVLVNYIVTVSRGVH